jgi:hypothetical protein
MDREDRTCQVFEWVLEQSQLGTVGSHCDCEDGEREGCESVEGT